MPIVTCESSKATPMKGLAYIMDKEKTLAKGSIGFMDDDDPEQMARQMMQTMHLHGKGRDKDERKYYHCKVSFDPQDLKENGGDLDEHKAQLFAAKYAARTWPGREVAWSVQRHGTAMHIHFIVAACDQETGKKLDARDAEYRRWKNRANDLAAEMGLSTLDWEKATKEKRQREIQSDNPISETFAEQGLQARGKTTWKDELREKIDAAIKSSCSMEEFRAQLEASGVTLTRCTDTTISYKLGDHRACRGDTLGGDYTAQAIRDALHHNSQAPVHASIDNQISNAAQRSGGRVISERERQQYREFGRLAGFKRSEIDWMCDDAPKATWEEKQRAWDAYKSAKDKFWQEYNVRDQALKEMIDDAYKRRRKVKNAEWVLDPRNRRASLGSIIFASIYLMRSDSLVNLDFEIQMLKIQQAQIRREMATFKDDTGEAVETLREKGLSLDAYMASVRRMQDFATLMQRRNADLNLDDAERERLQKEAERKRQQQHKGHSH